MAIVSDRRKLSEREITELERKKQLAAQRVSGKGSVGFSLRWEGGGNSFCSPLLEKVVRVPLN